MDGYGKANDGDNWLYFQKSGASCLFSSFWKLCGIFVFTDEDTYFVTWTNQTGSVRDLWSNSKEISHCCPSWYEVTEFAWPQIDPRGAGKSHQLAFPSHNPGIPLIPASSSFAKWWITDQRLALWWSPLSWCPIESPIIFFADLLGTLHSLLPLLFIGGGNLNRPRLSPLLGTLQNLVLSPSPAP